MKHLKKHTEANSNLKELALEKLRKTQGGSIAILQPSETTLGMTLTNPFKNF